MSHPNRPGARRDAVFYAIAHPARRQLLDRLGRGHSCVNELSRPFGMSRPAVSQHLKELLDAGLIRVRKIGRERHYALRPERLQVVQQWISQYQTFWAKRLVKLGKHLDRNP